MTMQERCAELVDAFKKIAADDNDPETDKLFEFMSTIHDRITLLERKPKLVRFTRGGQAIYIRPDHVMMVENAKDYDGKEVTTLTLAPGYEDRVVVDCTVEQALEAIEAA